jgi:hypothetical protein
MSTTGRTARPILLVVVDTEEERVWGTYSRDDVAVSATRHVNRAQRIFDEYRIRPTYVVDYPVASQAVGYEPLREISRSGRAVIGEHLHPWVNPPYVEEVTPRNTYAGNLPRDVERAKIESLACEIERNFGERPGVYKAGRYGIGPNTAAILDSLGFEVDLSTAPPYDLRGNGGPDFRSSPQAPYWLTDRILELPTTGAFVGLLSRTGPGLYPRITHPRWRWAKLPGICSRLGLLERIRLSPEGHEFRDHRAITEFLLRRGMPVLTWSFHSPTLMPGGSPYVRSHADLERFLDANRRYFDYVLGDLGGISMTPFEVRQEFLTRQAAR